MINGKNDWAYLRAVKKTDQILHLYPRSLRAYPIFIQLTAKLIPLIFESNV